MQKICTYETYQIPCICLIHKHYRLTPRHFLTLIATSLEESLADKVLQSCHTLKISISNIADLPITTETNSTGPTRQDVIQLNSIKMTTALQSLCTNSSVWASLYQSLPSALIHDLLSKMSDHVKVIGGQIVKFLQVNMHFYIHCLQQLNT